MQVRYRKTGKTDHVEFGDDGHGQLVLVGFADPYYLEEDGLPDPDEPYSIGPDKFAGDWELVEASDDERRRLRDAGFLID
jgi:hypothetical protein